VPPRGKEFRYAVDLHENGTVRSEDGTALEQPDDWTPEHLLLAALVRCTLKSLRHHARRAGIDVSNASGTARALVTKRESDGRYALARAEVSLDVRLEPQPGRVERTELLAKAERDCFVGASLTAAPRYRWNVT
jgi:organic hydroperoxide reductase OsmC/OhrA